MHFFINFQLALDVDFCTVAFSGLFLTVAQLRGALTLQGEGDLPCTLPNVPMDKQADRNPGRVFSSRRCCTYDVRSPYRTY
jgi:hypothetical protein